MKEFFIFTFMRQFNSHDFFLQFFAFHINLFKEKCVKMSTFQVILIFGQFQACWWLL